VPLTDVPAGAVLQQPEGVAKASTALHENYFVAFLLAIDNGSHLKQPCGKGAFVHRSGHWQFMRFARQSCNIVRDLRSIFGDTGKLCPIEAFVRDVDAMHSERGLGGRTAAMVTASSRDGAPPLRVALCHLESLVCLPAIDRLFGQMDNRIGLVILSNRFASRHGGLLRQFMTNVRRSGFSLTLWLGFDIVAAQLVGCLGAGAERLTGRQPRFGSVRMHASARGATVLETADVNGADTIAALRAYAPDLVLVMNFDQILRREFIAASGRVVNVHPSLLPALRGPCPVFWALAEGRSEVGVSLHLIEDENIDVGPLLAQHARALDGTQSVAESVAQLFEEGVALIPDVVRALRKGCIVGRAQAGAAASYRGFPDRADMARARRKGVRLFCLRPIAKLLTGAIS
jgi:folate-dependent phosphoribosylglycinamide formyltransferase PurN